MIDEICVYDVALIRQATMCPSTGLTVLTGETGAGKTALLSACKLLMGGRSDKTMVREGAEEARVEGRFFLPSSSKDEDDSETLKRDKLDECSESDKSVVQVERKNISVEDASDEESEVVVTRRLSADGRSRVSVNGVLSSVTQLSELIAPTVDLCGQHEYQSLLKPATHCALLDEWAGEDIVEARTAYEAAYQKASEAKRAWENLQQACNTSQAALDEARFTLRQIDSISPDEEEYDNLIAYLEKAEHAEALASATHGAHEALTGENGALDDLNGAIEALSEGGRFDDVLSGYEQSLREVGYVLEDVSRDVASYCETIDYDPDELSRAQERISSIQSLMRNFGPRLEDVLARRSEAFEIVAATDDTAERERVAQAHLDAAEEELTAAAHALHEARCAVAPRFAKEVSAVMSQLQMGTAELLCEVEFLPRESWTAAGPSAVEFFFRPASAMQSRPLARIASGGEISRVMLAIHVVCGYKDNVETLVFDEVDAGVGGNVANALADVLSDVAKTHQVIVVTHLAQVAARADVHYVVEKSQDAIPQTNLYKVIGLERIGEIARMLSGSATEASLAHAAELLEAASSQ